MIWASLVRLASGRANALHPRRQWALSLTLAGLFVTLGLSALPRDVTTDANAILLRDPAGSDAGIGTPVFVLRDSGVAVRFGNATAKQDGVIRVGLYDPLDPLLATATEPVSLPGDPRLLWLLAAPDERRSLREALDGLARVLPETAVAMLQSPEFTGIYRDRLVLRLRLDLTKAWEDARASDAWRDLMRGYEPILRDAASRDLRPIVESHFRAVPMRVLRANALRIINPFADAQWNLAPVEDALTAALQEVRERDLPDRLARRLLEAPPTGEFVRAFIEAMSRQLVHDVALRDLVVEMVEDERFRPYLNTLLTRLMDLARIAPRLLVSLHGSTDLNPVASSVIRTLVSGRNDRVVVYMSPAQRDEMIARDPDAVRPLMQAASG